MNSNSLQIDVNIPLRFNTRDLFTARESEKDQRTSKKRSKNKRQTSKKFFILHSLSLGLNTDKVGNLTVDVL